MTDEYSVVSEATADLARLRAMLSQTREGLARKKGVHRSPDGLVSVTVDGNGRVLTLTITHGTIRAIDPEVLAKTVLETINAGKTRAMSRSNEIVQDVLDAWGRGQ